MKITVLMGGASAEREVSLATGEAIARAGYTLLNGGYGGTMAATAKGARLAGGHTIGVTCSAFGRGGPNPYIEKEITTATLQQRLQRLIELGRAYVVLPGGTGTLLELATVWELSNKGFLKPARPIILMGRFWRPLLEAMVSQQPSAGTGWSAWLDGSASPPSVPRPPR